MSVRSWSVESSDHIELFLASSSWHSTGRDILSVGSQAETECPQRKVALLSICIDNTHRSSAPSAVGLRLDPTWWTHWIIYHSNQFSTTGVAKVILSKGRYI